MPPMQHGMPPQGSQLPSQTYQSYVPGLSGWNDPPKAKKLDSSALSHIESPPSHIASCMSRISSQLAPKIPPNQGKMWQDTEKRLEALYDALADGNVREACLIGLVECIEYIDKADFSGASRVVLGLLEGAIGDESRWAMGVRRLVDMYARYGA